MAKSIGKEFVDWAVTLGVAVVLALLIRHFLFAIFIVDGESMYPTLKDSEWLIVNKAIYVVGEPRKNDIVVFHATATRDYIKRVIAVEGDELEMVNGEVYVNGNLLDEPYINEPMSYHNNYDKIVIPENKIFVMGDNRNKSADSRMHDIGFIDVDQVVGRAELAFWPINDIRRVK
ncbi:signal peptidase I [Desulfuribacillus stibiiarsenatis]|uniref:Signal peptidase I n=1 Tax=Desulfuribacillus stibiiarsenatis TaxID=1390249 RepID=A0A1E5L731_9FIRM|nr:signal peptidase I [Desulfuribacillus stibiiarsenatis]